MEEDTSEISLVYQHFASSLQSSLPLLVPLPPSFPKHSAFQFIPVFTPHLTIQTTCPFGQLCPTFEHAASLFLASAPPFLPFLPIPDYYRPLSRNKLQQWKPRRLLNVTIRETFSFSLPCFFNQVAIPCSRTPSPFPSLSRERKSTENSPVKDFFPLSARI